MGTSKIDHDYFLRGYRRGRGILEFLEEGDVYIRNGQVVEIGCGPGGILKTFQEEGNKVWGCELDKKNCVKYGNSQGLKILYGDIETLANAGIKADLVILSHLLEHIPSPIQFIKSLHKILKETGFVYIEVPGVRNPRTDFFAGVQVAHLYYFDLITLQYVMGKAGFRLVTGNERISSIFRASESANNIPIEKNFERNAGILL